MPRLGRTGPRGRAVEPWKRRLLGTVLVSLYWLVLVLGILPHHAAGRADGMGYIIGGVVGALTCSAALFRDLYRFTRLSAAAQNTVVGGIAAVAVVATAVGTTPRFAVAGVCLGALAVLGISAVTNLFEAPATSSTSDA